MTATPATPGARKGEVFLRNRGLYLGDHGFEPDPGRVGYADEEVVFYHYTRQEHLDSIFAAGGGLRARVAMVPTDLTPEFVGIYCVNGFLEPVPRWLANCPHFGDFCLELFKRVAGDLLIEVRVPANWPGLYVVDNAHWIEGYHIKQRGDARLKLGYVTATGRESARATTHSTVPLRDYHGGHVCPNIQATRRGEGIAIPSVYLRIADEQPLR